MTGLFATGPDPRIGMEKTIGDPVVGGLITPRVPRPQAMPGPGGGGFGTAFAALAQSPAFHQFLQGQMQQSGPAAPSAPGLIMPRARVQQFTPTQATAIRGLFG